jgi:hypothetical protein
MLKSLVKTVLQDRIARKIDTIMQVQKDFSDAKAITELAEAVRKFSDERGFNEPTAYELLYQIARKLQPRFVINDRARTMLNDEAFWGYFEEFADGNYKNFERRWNVKEFLKQIQDVKGNLAECGVYKGATAFQLCTFASQNRREVHLFDSYEGLSEPGIGDGSFWTKGGLSASETLVRENLKEFDCFKTFRGWIPEAFPLVDGCRYAFLHVDVDLEEPTYDTMAFFYPRLNPGAIILLDDHGYDTCPGARKAVLEFMADKPEPVIDLSTGQGLIIKN